jgi:hypothetical protein
MNCPTPPGGSERGSLCKGAGHADGEIQAGANDAGKEAEIALTALVSTPCPLALPIRH